jgi:hypothetical protein
LVQLEKEMDFQYLELRPLGLYLNGARITVNPRYNVNSEDGDIIIGCAKDDTEVELTASKDDQSVKVSQRINDSNRIAPTVS